MAVATTTALLIGAGISAATQAWGAHKAGEAAKDAAKQQESAGREALALQKEMYERTRADQAPFRNVGSQAFTTLGAMAGLPNAPVAGQTLPEPGTIGAAAQGPSLKDQFTQYHEDTGGSIFKWIGERNTRRPGGTGQDETPSPTDGAPAPIQNASGYTRMRSPDGAEEEDVPNHMVPHVLQSGGMRV